VLDLVKAGRPVRKVAADLDMPSRTIYVWLRQDRIDSGMEPGVRSSDRAELVAARGRIAELETELTITRRAIELLPEAVPPKGGSGPSR
jgi:transposase-like protein